MPRPQLRDQLALLLDLLMSDYHLTAPGEKHAHKLEHTQRGALQQLQLSRHQQRPTTADFIARTTSSFTAIRGDRIGTLISN